MISPTVIKIPSHLIPLLTTGKSVIAADYYDADFIKAFEEITIKEKENIFFNILKNYFNEHFTAVEVIDSPGDVIVRGDTVTVWLHGYSNPIRLSFFGEECESIDELDSISLMKIHNLERVVLLPPSIHAFHEHITINDTNDDLEAYIFTQHPVDDPIVEKYIETDFSIPSLYFSKLEIFNKELASLTEQKYEVFIQTKNQDNLPENLQKYAKAFNYEFDIENNKVEAFETTDMQPLLLPAGFISQDLQIAYFTERELFGTISVSNKSYGGIENQNVNRLLQQFEGAIEILDFVVHEDYGVGQYKGMTQEKVGELMNDYLLIEYAAGDEVYVPLHQIEKITKYIGPEGVDPELSRLGSVKWKNLRKKVKASTRMLAKELIEHYAKRELSKARDVAEIDTESYRKFVDTFPYEETVDQRLAISEVLKDLQSNKPMNRLLIGDVGFGKTEVVMRAAFKAVEPSCAEASEDKNRGTGHNASHSDAGGQVAILAPTTVLVAQHYKVLKERFKDFDISIEYVSRFKKPYENKSAIQKAKEGKVDILIGTHRLLSNDVDFKNLQLLVVDEEQKFGVKQKEKIKKLNYGVHVLSVSATPIPRTLSMALSSIQDISIITTPPKGRQSVHTEIIKDNWDKAIKAINAEVERGGQVFFVHNEIKSIKSIEAKLNRLAPHVKVVIAHGRMNADELDKIMYDFYQGSFDVLLCTTIIENGLDVENANTMIISRAHAMGLSQLYQLRGRVGRSERKAYCYLMYTGSSFAKASEDETPTFASIDDQVNHNLAKKKASPKKYLERLQTLVDNQDLGAGYRIASKDLEIRGAGNILGQKQHGHISAIGYTLYIQMLAQEIERLRTVLT